MSDYSSSKPRSNKSYPQQSSIDGAGAFKRVEEFMTPEVLKKQFLFGIPLKSPLTGETMDDDTLKAIINKSAAKVELDCGIDIFSTQREVRLDFDYVKYFQGWGQLDLGFPNLKSLEELSIRTVESTSTENNPPPSESSGRLIYALPLAFIDIQSLGHKGIIHIVPLQTAYSGTGIVGTSGIYSGAATTLLTVFNQLRWTPAFWYAKATFGFDNNAIPSPINQLIGYEAALMILSQLGPTQKYNSKSINIDGVGQSLGGPGIQQFAQRAQDVKEKIAELRDLIKARFYSKITMTYI